MDREELERRIRLAEVAKQIVTLAEKQLDVERHKERYARLQKKAGKMAKKEKVKMYVKSIEEDILNLFPVVKHINPRATDAYNFYTTGQSKIQQGFLKDGYELISEALNLLNNVYGVYFIF